MIPRAAGESPPDKALSAGKVAFRIIGGLFLMFAIIAAAGGLFFLSTDAGEVGRFLIASAVSIGVAALGIGYFRQLGNPPPPDMVPATVHPSLRLAYVCEMCGMELAVVKVAKEKAPKHCGEEMVLVRV